LTQELKVPDPAILRLSMTTDDEIVFSSSIKKKKFVDRVVFVLMDIKIYAECK
jgi:hypothetical protein